MAVLLVPIVEHTRNNMENGTYGNAITDFRKLTLKKFPASLYNPITFGMNGCGANALSLITGKHPAEIKAKNKHKDHFPDSFMVKYLRNNGVTPFKITKCNLTGRTKKEHSDLFGYITNDNLLLVSQLLKKNEASWGVYWGGLWFHNFELSRTDFMSLLNFPIVSAYCLYNPKWA